MIFDDLTEIEALVNAQDTDSLRRLTKTVQAADRKTLLRPHRNPLMVSAVKPSHLNKLDTLASDIAVINLEDGVSPQQKPLARALAALFVSFLKADHSGPLISIRINPLGQGGEEDLAAIREVKPHAVRIPKVRSAADVSKALRLTDESCEIHLSVETADAFRNIHNLKTSERVTLMYLGMLDLLADMKAPHQMALTGSPVTDYIRARFFTEVKLAGAEPVSFVYQNYKNLELFREFCISDREYGYRGKGCISPAQANIAAEIFSADPAETARALYIKEKFEENAGQGITGFSDEKYGFIDEPVYRDALNVLDTEKDCRKVIPCSIC